MKHWMKCGAVVMTLLAGLALPWAAEAKCTVNTQTIANRDGSALILRQEECPDQDQRNIRVSYRPDAKHKAYSVLTLSQSIEEASTGGAHSIDLEADGQFEIEVRGMCGAGPNCEGTIYKLASDKRSMFEYFSGGYADLRLQDGYLIEGGRASCCSWEFHLYRTDATDRPIDESAMEYMVTVGVLLKEGSDQVEGSDCQVSRREGNDWKAAPPPTPGLARLCEVYGTDYRLNPATDQ